MSDAPNTPTPAASAGPDPDAESTQEARDYLARQRAASAGPDFEAADRDAEHVAGGSVKAVSTYANLARAYLALRSLPREGEAPVAWTERFPDELEALVMATWLVLGDWKSGSRDDAFAKARLRWLVRKVRPDRPCVAVSEEMAKRAAREFAGQMGEPLPAPETGQTVTGTSDDGVVASSACPVCGKSEPHRHEVESRLADDFGPGEYPGGPGTWAAAYAAPPLPAGRGSEVSEAVRLIAAERERQKSVEGWTEAHDDEHHTGDLGRAAACYAEPDRDTRDGVPFGWPWAGDWWKPTPDDRVRELVKAGALIVAEIERLQRAALGRGREGAV